MVLGRELLHLSKCKDRPHGRQIGVPRPVVAPISGIPFRCGAGFEYPRYGVAKVSAVFVGFQNISGHRLPLMVRVRWRLYRASECAAQYRHGERA